ncbi:SPOR domain-containing protein [Marinomonas balearica]|uniref:Sporulation related protein n=1 Tax=Marinomonas balearica TaxID=491947 RepID=A0A4R6M9S9_9GAMM|nr:SPOR domain-containing protein [Marinomonas balearica]TDO97390.1 sporulation related protein [Marinomonas balearica]
MMLKIFPVVFLASAICACATQKPADVADVMTNEQLETMLLKQQKEWNEMKPQLQRILALESDLKLLVETLDTVPESSEALTQQTVTSSDVQESLQNVPILPSSALIEIESAENGAAHDNVTSDIVDQSADNSESSKTNHIATEYGQDSSRSKPVLVQFYNTPSESDRIERMYPFGVQLAAYFSFSQAQNAWPKLQKQHAHLVKDLSPMIAHSVIKGRDYYRLIVGPIAKKANGKALCFKFKKNNQDCLVTRFQGTMI